MNIQEETPSAPQWPYILGLCTMAFLLMVTYAIARPASESLYLTTYGSKSLPWVWLAVAVVAVLVVSLYNRIVPHIGLLKLFVLIMAISGTLMTLLLLGRYSGIPGVTFVLYLWKDVYIVVLVEIFWSFANNIFPIRTAKWVYGLFGVMGSLGGVVGNLAVGPLARKFGTMQTLWAILPIFALLSLVCLAFAKRVGDIHAKSKESKPTDLRSGWRVLQQSDYLLLMFFLIAIVQIVVTLIDYQYSRLIEITYTTTDNRTVIIGQVYAIIELLAIVLQLSTGLILRLFGVPLTLMGIPFLLLVCSVGFILFPGFLAVAITKIASKSTSYSLFRAAKEILYIPLTYEEKTQGKAFVDILMYRFAKGFASLILLGLLVVQLQTPRGMDLLHPLFLPVFHALTALNNSIFVSLIALVLLLVWFWLMLLIVRRYRKKVSRQDEI